MSQTPSLPPKIPPSDASFDRRAVAYEPHGVTRSVDDSHLTALAVCHYVWGALLLLFSSFGLIHVAIGVAMIGGAFNPPVATTTPGTVPVAMGNPPIDGWFGWFFVLFGGAFVLLGWTLAICTIVAGRALAKRRRRTFAIVVAVLNCLIFPFGTALGVFTLVVLLRPSVQTTFADAS